MTSRPKEMTHSLDWADIVRRARQLEPAAFDLIVEEYAPRLCGYFRRNLARADVEDLVQEVLLRVVRSIGHYSEDGRFEAWIFRLAANLARDQVREQRRNSSIPLHPKDDRAEGYEPKAANPTGTWSTPDEEMTQRLHRAMEALPEAEREVIVLRHYGRLTFEEIAEMMNTPLGTALARAHRGLTRLRESMEAVQ